MADDRSASTPVRAMLALLACAGILLGLAWVRSAHAQTELLAIYRTSDPVALSQAIPRVDALTSRRFAFYPDTSGRLTKAIVLFGLHHPTEANQILKEVTAEQPENAQAWALMELLDRLSGNAGWVEARRQLLKVDPLFFEVP